MAVSSQIALSSMTDKFGGRLPVRVFFLDNSSKMFLLDETTTISQFISIILVKFDVTNNELFVPYFGLFESLDGASISSCRGLEERVGSIIEQWGSTTGSHPNAKFVFMIRLFMPCIYGLEYEDTLSRQLKRKLTLREYLSTAAIRDPSLLYFQYMQAVYGVITGQYPTTEEIALKLATFHFNHKFGDYNPSSHKSGFLGGRVVEFIPIKLLKQKSLEQWETLLLEAIEDKATNFDSQEELKVSPQRMYMNEIFPMIPFGCTLFKCKINSTTSTSPFVRSIPGDCVLGIHHLGIHVFEKGSSRKLLRSFRIEEMSRWCYKGSEFFNFEIQSSSDISGILEFQTPEGKVISDLMTDYALAYVREKELEDARAVAAGETIANNSNSSNGGNGSSSNSNSNNNSSNTPNGKEKDLRRKSATRTSISQQNGSPDGKSSPAPAAGASSSPSTSTRRPSSGKASIASSVPPAPANKPTKPAPPAPKPVTTTPKPETKLADAAVKIQSVYRGYNLRKELTDEDAAILIQSVYRGYRDRIMVSAMIEDLLAGDDY